MKESGREKDLGDRSSNESKVGMNRNKTERNSHVSLETKKVVVIGASEFVSTVGDCLNIFVYLPKCLGMYTGAKWIAAMLC